MALCHFSLQGHKTSLGELWTSISWQGTFRSQGPKLLAYGKAGGPWQPMSPARNLEQCILTARITDAGV